MIHFEDVVKAVSESMHVRPGTLMGSLKSKHVAECRAVLYVLARRYTRLSYSELAVQCNRHYSSVLHAVAIFPSRCERDPTLLELLDEAEDALKARLCIS